LRDKHIFGGGFQDWMKTPSMATNGAKAVSDNFPTQPGFAIKCPFGPWRAERLFLIVDR
jgi:hypothetical protein